jgi:hypothetical protein
LKHQQTYAIQKLLNIPKGTPPTTFCYCLFPTTRHTPLHHIQPTLNPNCTQYKFSPSHLHSAQAPLQKKTGAQYKLQKNITKNEKKVQSAATLEMHTQRQHNKSKYFIKTNML